MNLVIKVFVHVIILAKKKKKKYQELKSKLKANF